MTKDVARSRRLAEGEKINVSFPQPVYDALTEYAVENYETIGGVARRFVVERLRAEGKLPPLASPEVVA